MDTEWMKNELIYGNLIHLGNYYGLRGVVEPSRLREELKEFSNDWHPYNPDKLNMRREGLSLTSLDGEMTGEELTSLGEFNKKNKTSYGELDFTQPTPALKKLTSLHAAIEPFLPYLGRTHLLRLGTGGFFPPHRDSQKLGTDSFRLISLVDNCDPEEFHFIYDNKKIFLSPSRLYFMNTKVTHSLCSFTENNILFVANVRLTEESAHCVIRNLEST